MCPCPQDNGQTAIALIVCIGLVIVVKHLWKGWPTMSSQIRSLIIVAAVVSSVAGVAYVRSGANCGTGEQAGARLATSSPASMPAGTSGGQATRPAPGGPLPRLVDLGAGKCIPCKKMAPILDELKKEFAGRLDVEFIDVWQKPDAGKPYQIKLIPTQIFFDASGKELFRHEGFFSREDILGKWKELGVDLSGKPAAAVERAVPTAADSRPKDGICFMCDGDVGAKNRVLVKGQEEQIVLCSPHCLFIYHSSLKEPEKAEAVASVTDAISGKSVPATTAAYLYGLDTKGRPTVLAFADREAASTERQKSAGNVLDWQGLRRKELATRCGFCDRAVYPEDACPVKVEESTHTYGCCTMCALGVAARLKKDIEVEAKDALSGDVIRVGTLNGSIASLEPKTAVAWAGGKKAPDGKWASTGCFKQAFFTSEANLKTWLDKHPAATGRMVTMGEALASKMKLTPEQIAGACKLGECK